MRCVDVNGVQGGRCSWAGGDLKRRLCFLAGADSNLLRGGADGTPLVHQVVEAHADLQWLSRGVFQDDRHSVRPVELRHLSHLIDGKYQRTFGDGVPVESAQRTRGPEGDKPQRD